MIIYKVGDLLKSNSEVIAHGCNCFLTMGSGIARSIREQFPEAYEADCKTRRGDMNKLGTFSKVDTTKFRVYNLYSQFGYGGFDPLHRTNYLALTNAMTAMKKDILENYGRWPSVSFPRIGCGLGAGKWADVERIIEQVFVDLDVYVYDLPEVPKMEETLRSDGFLG